MTRIEVAPDGRVTIEVGPDTWDQAAGSIPGIKVVSGYDNGVTDWLGEPMVIPDATDDPALPAPEAFRAAQARSGGTLIRDDIGEIVGSRVRITSVSLSDDRLLVEGETCEFCGSPAARPVVPGNWRCAACGARQGERKCPGCGQRTTRETLAQNGQDAPPQDRRGIARTIRDRMERQGYYLHEGQEWRRPVEVDLLEWLENPAAGVLSQTPLWVGEHGDMWGITAAMPGDATDSALADTVPPLSLPGDRLYVGLTKSFGVGVPG